MITQAAALNPPLRKKQHTKSHCNDQQNASNCTVVNTMQQEESGHLPVLATIANISQPQERSLLHPIQPLSSEAYLHQQGWLHQEQKLHEQSWVSKEMQLFHSKQSQWNNYVINYKLPLPQDDP